MDRDRTPFEAFSISPQSRRILDASITAGTSGPAFWAMHVFLTCFVSCLMIGAWTATGWVGMATLKAREVGMEAFGIPFFGFFAILATILWAAEIRFLRLAFGRSDVSEV